MSQTAFRGRSLGLRKSALVLNGKVARLPSPTGCCALSALAKAGVDVLYILTGRRIDPQFNLASQNIAEEFSRIRREMLEPSRFSYSGENEQQAEDRIIKESTRRLDEMADGFERCLIDADTMEQIELFREVARDREKLNDVRSVEKRHLVQRRDWLRQELADWTFGGNYVPGDGVMYALLDIAVEFKVPPRQLGDLIREINRELDDREKLEDRMKPKA